MYSKIKEINVKSFKNGDKGIGFYFYFTVTLKHETILFPVTICSFFSLQ